MACTNELRRRYFPEDANWIVQQGSVLDTSYLATLGTYDIVYSWGVLHHTGAMWQALENVKQLVRPGGELFIAIYNELGQITDYWTRVKKLYNALPPSFRVSDGRWDHCARGRYCCIQTIPGGAFQRVADDLEGVRTGFYPRHEPLARLDGLDRRVSL